MPQNNKKKIKAGMTVEFRRRVFDVVRYDGLLYNTKKGRLLLQEQKSMFDGATDFFLDEMSEYQIKQIKIL